MPAGPSAAPNFIAPPGGNTSARILYSGDEEELAMGAHRTPAPLGAGAAFMELDEGTLCRAASPLPGILQGGDKTALNVLEEVAQLAKKAAAGLGEHRPQGCGHRCRAGAHRSR